MPLPIVFGAQTRLVDMLVEMSLLARVVLFILIVFSAISWGIMGYKWRQISRAAAQTRSFLKTFRASAKFSEVKAVCDDLRQAPLVGLFLAGFNELNFQINAFTQENRAAAEAGKIRIKSTEGISRALTRAASVEIGKLERNLNFLATTASVTPFIGLFGTVVGIINAFSNIGASGQTGLESVAPGIAEALVVTAAGLAAAIPAVIGYNYYAGRVKVIASEMDDFSLEFLSITERNFT
ncbi:MAG: MotA/TolQ/ExbB proton channel family protein [Acidobacteriota bacterium]